MKGRRTGRRRGWAATTAVGLVATFSGAVAVPPAAAADDTVTRPVLADASIDEGSPGTNYGANTRLWVDNSPVYRFLVKLDVSVPAGKVLKKATLSLACANSSPAAGSIRLLSGSWSEASVTWSNAPTFGETVATMGVVSSGTRYDIDVTAAAQGKTELSIGWVGGSKDGADFGSKEATSSVRPSLVVVYGDGTTPEPEPEPEPGVDDTVTRPVLADASIDEGSPGTNYGANTRLWVDNSPVYRFLVKLDVSVPAGKVLKKATLSLACVNSSPAAGSIRLLSGSWSEASVTWSNAPTFGETVATMGTVSSGTRYDIDVTAAAQGKTELSTGWVGGSKDGADFGSKEATSSVRPSLVVVYGDGTTPAPEPEPEPEPEPGEAFDLALIGDTPYSSSEVEDLLDLRTTMNVDNLAYVVHVGDIKSGSSACTDSVYTDRRTIFNGFDDPFVYTPGDNEWSDCDDIELDRLDYLRRVFFPDDQTLGQRKETVARQLNYPENARWTKGGIMFATVHTVGSSDYGGTERDARRRANVEWIHAAFDAAEAAGSRGVVIVTHANWGSPYGTSRTAFEAVKGALHEEVLASNRPVVFVHGDTHTFRIDKPLKDADGNTVQHFTRIEVHAGADDWVRLRVTTGPEVFVPSSESR